MLSVLLVATALLLLATIATLVHQTRRLARQISRHSARDAATDPGEPHP